MSVTKVVAHLEGVVAELSPTGSEQGPPPIRGDVWPQLCRHCLRGWVAATRRDFIVAQSALRGASTARRWETRVRRYEEAVWRLVSVPDRLSAVLALGLHTPVLERYGQGVRFKVDGKKLRAEIERLAHTSGSARELHRLWCSVRDHQAVQLRHTITHKLPSVDELPPLVFLEDVYDRGGGRKAYERTYLVAGKVPSSLDPQVMIDEGLRAARDLFQRLLSAADLVAQVLADSGKLYPPRVCHYRRGSDGNWKLDEFDL